MFQGNKNAGTLRTFPSLPAPYSSSVPTRIALEKRRPREALAHGNSSHARKHVISRIAICTKGWMRAGLALKDGEQLIGSTQGQHANRGRVSSAEAFVTIVILDIP